MSYLLLKRSHDFAPEGADFPSPSPHQQWQPSQRTGVDHLPSLSFSPLGSLDSEPRDRSQRESAWWLRPC